MARVVQRSTVSLRTAGRWRSGSSSDRTLGLEGVINCALTRACPYFNGQADITNEVLVMYRARYCKGSTADCARYLVFTALGREAVPAELHPNDKLKALAIVRQAANASSGA